MAYNYQNLPGLNGNDNTSGTQVFCYAAPVRDFLAIKGFKTTELSGDSVTIDGDHTFTAPKGFIKLYGTLGTGQITAEPVGDRDGEAKSILYKFFHPGNKKEAAEFDRKAKNEDWIFLVRDADGTTIQIGSEFLPAKIKGKFDTQTIGNGRRGWEFEVSAFANGLTYYEGVITEKTEEVAP